MRKKTKFHNMKCMISVITSLALLIVSFPYLEELDNDDSVSTLVVHAVVEDYGQNPTLYSAQNIIDYSKAYREYPQNHYKDHITINRSNDLATTSFEGFMSLGTPKYPFAGTITFNSTATHEINIDTAFFDYVYDYVTIDGGVDLGINKHMIINPLSDNTDAVLANHVLHEDEGQKAPATWTVEIASYNGTNHTHGSLIGEMGKNSEVTVNLINSYSVAVENDIKVSGGNIMDTGTICGVMQTGSKLTVTSVTGSAAASITSSNGHAGGLVGKMEEGSTLTISGSTSNYVSNTSAITASNGYAGGIVGYNDQASVTVTSGYAVIKNTITGSLGAGGLYGYYKPIMTSSAYSLSLDNFTIGDSSTKCTVSSSSGGAGGFFGKLDNPGGTITLSGSNSKPVYVTGSGENFGGIIGNYQANELTDTLSVSGSAADNMLTVYTKRSENLSYYGGIIGIIDGTSFADISNVSVAAANTDYEYFGGAVACADSGYVYVKNFSLDTSLSNAKGGGVVGHCENGVVHLAGTTDISSATFTAGSADYGQIVGYRDSALVFAESGWKLIRNGINNSVDDIGSWGEVVRFKASDFTIDSVLDDYYKSSDAAPVHYAKLKGATIDNNTIKLSSKSTFATAALNMQLNDGSDTSSVLQFSDCTYDTLKQKDIVMTANIDLSNTGMTGLTRDNGSHVEYSGSEFDGGNHTLTLAIGAGYEGTDSSVLTDSSGKGKIYCHRYNGIFGETTEDFTVKNLTITGKVHTHDFAGKDAPFYTGTVAGIADKNFNADKITVDNDTSIVYGTNSADDELYVGGLVGKMTEPNNSTIGASSHTADSINSTFSAKVSGSAEIGTVYVGGVCGYVGANGIVSVTDVKITNEVSNSETLETQKIGGLFAVIEDGTNNTTLKLNGVELNGLTVKGKMSDGGSMGGLLGYSWDGVTATFDNIKVSECALNNLSSSGNQAALVYTGSGYWQFKSVQVNGLTLTGSAASSLGMLVNKAHSSTKAMYLELPESFTYTLTNVTGTAPTIYDEIAVYTIMPDNSIEANGNSVISINTTGTTIYGSQSDTKVNMSSGSCNTYQNQVTASGFNKYNPNTRYYYNLDKYKNKNSPTAAEKLFLYSVKQYAHNSIQDNFTAPSEATFADASNTDTLDLDGYSYYPFDVIDTVNISGTVKLHNQEIENKESALSGGKDSYARTTIKDNNTTTQHYLMHAGLFRNVSGTVNINGALTIGGTIPDTGDYCGVLICGTIGGSASGNATITSNNTGASVSLAGINIHNQNTTFSPLLINKASGYVVMDIYHVSADSTKYTSGVKIATSLIGKLGSDTAEKVRVTFNDVKLDARSSSDAVNLDSVYGTTGSLFTRATLLESLTYASGSGSFGVYNYEYSDDWGSSPAGRNVTYGKEISSSDSKNYGKEFWYYNEDHSLATAHITDPSTHTACGSETTITQPPYNFQFFLPYVAVWGAGIGSSTTKHQLNVNHAAATFSGCGTYNDPFTIAATDTDSDKSGGLVTISQIIAGNVSSLGNSYKISLPDDITPPNTWCDDKKKCTVYTFDGTDTFVHPTDTSKNKELSDVRKYLAGAYYYLSTDVEFGANSGFEGLGGYSSNSEVEDFAVFRGVIYGDGHTITNQTNSPLIYASNGCVVKNLKIEVGESGSSVSVSLTGNKDALFASSGGCGAYGAVIGRVMGGDNIIDQVSVDVSNVTVSPTTLTPVGGYIGVILYGGVFFRNMDDESVPPANKMGFAVDNNGKATEYAESNKKYLYCNPIIGRVINGFAVTESSVYAPYENGSRTFGDESTVSGNAVTMKNGNKNYSITDIKQTENKLSVSGKTIDVPNSQAFFIMSLIVNSGMGTGKKAVIGYYGDNQITRHAEYSHVGTDIKVSDYKTNDNTDAQAQAEFEATDEYVDYAKTSSDTNASPYLIAQYTTGDSANTLGSDTEGFTLNVNADIILPDGYKGIGNFYQNDERLRLAIKTFDGKSKTISQNTTNYCYHPKLDNYYPGKGSDEVYYKTDICYYRSFAGLGLFNCQTKFGTYKDFTLTGNVKGVVYHTDGTKYHSPISKKEYTYIKSDVDNENIQSMGSLFGTLVYLTTDGETTNINNVNLSNVDVQSAKNAGGLIGFIPLNSAYNDSWDNKIININNNNDSSKIKITAGLNAGGLIGFYYMGGINIDFNGKHFDISRIESECSGRNTGTNDWDYGCGGLIGVIRCNSANPITDKGISSNKAVVKNIIIGTTNQATASVVTNEKAQTANPIYVGGVFGILNRAPILTENLTINNLSVYGKSYTGGIVGWAGTYSQSTFINTNMYSNDTAKATVENNDSANKGQVGGFVGFCKESASETRTFTVMNSSIKGYTISHYTMAGGVLGGWKTSDFPFNIKNFEISDCTVKTTAKGNQASYVGGIVANLSSASAGLQGYNILANNLILQSSANSDKQKIGAVCGNISSSIIKIVGFSYQSDTNLSTDKVIGSGSNKEDGYVIYADYNGSSLLDGKNTSFSKVNGNDNVTSKIVYKSVDLLEIQNSNGDVKRNRTYGYDDNGRGISVTSGASDLTIGETVTKYVITKSGNNYTIKKSINGGVQTTTTSSSLPKDYPTTWRSNAYTATLTVTEIVIDGTKAPYVTVNPSLTIDHINGETGLLTGDGISQSAVTNILTDINGGTSNKRYQNTGVTISDNLWSTANNSVNSDIISSFSAEFEDVINGKLYNFPLLIVNETGRADSVINSYLKVLTNTSLDFSNNVTNETYGSVAGSTDIATVTIQKCTYNNGSYTLSTTDPCLKISNDLFVINTDSNDKEMYDTSVTTGQFTLIDVAFKDPENTDEVAYHLYVPVLVKKLLEYNFDISTVSGSTYDQALYTGYRGNNVVENLGSPVTMEFEYSYLRTPAEWEAEEDNNYNLDKYLEFAPQTVEKFAGTTKLVLVDINRGGKEYYLDKWSDGYDNSTKLLNLQAFKDADGNSFSPKTFQELLKDQTVSGDKTLKEKYYLSVFTDPFERPDTPEGAELVEVIHYSVTSSNIGNAEHPTRRVDCTDQASGSYHYVTHLIIGDFYTNTMSVSTPQNATERMSNSNKTITVNMTASIDIVNEGTRISLRDYLGKSNVNIYQSLLASFDKYRNASKYDTGITAIDGYSVISYSIKNKDNENITITRQDVDRNANYIEFQNNTDISQYLQNGIVKIELQARLDFNSEITRLAQFPYKSGDDAITGAIVKGYSNISSNQYNTAYSVVSSGSSDSNSKYYYCESEESVVLKYYADYSNATKQNQLDAQLGINAREIESNYTNSFIQTEGRYDVSGLVKAENAQYIKCSLKLYQKQDSDNSYHEVSISDYLDNLKVNPEKTPVYYETSAYTYVFAKDDVAEFENEDNVYKIPITFSAKTGNQTNFKNNSSYLYANYKIELIVSLFDHDGTEDENKWSNHMSNSAVSDFVIYTNARIYTDLINTGS